MLSSESQIDICVTLGCGGGDGRSGQSITTGKWIDDASRRQPATVTLNGMQSDKRLSQLSIHSAAATTAKKEKKNNDAGDAE